MRYWNKICGFVMIFFITSLFSTAQSAKNQTIVIPSVNFVKDYSVTWISKNKNRNSLLVQSPVKIIAANYYSQHLGFFCRRELAVEKAVRVALRIRLGSLQQCNLLEGKK
jgi:hypothetical protein